MIEITESAVRQLRTLVGVEGDAVIERDGVKFFVDEESAQLLRGSTLDYRDALTGAGFQIVNPNAARTCGCGSSFEPARPL